MALNPLEMIEPEQMVWAINSDGSQSRCVNLMGTNPIYYRLVYEGPARDSIMATPYDVCKGYHIPMLEVGYALPKIGRWQRPYGFKCE